MTCEFLPPTLSTRRTRAASIIASAASVLRHGGREAEIVLLDGSTVTAAEFAALVQTAKRHDGMVSRETQRHIDDILAVAGERELLERAEPRPVEYEDNLGRTLAAYGAISFAASMILIAALAFGQDVKARTDATLAQATQAQFVEWSE